MSQATLPQIPIATLKPGLTVDSVYHLLSFEQRTKKNGEPFFTMMLGDATGQTSAIMWENHAPILSGIVAADDFIRVQADAAEYNGGTQLSLKKLSRVDDAEVDTAAFLPVSPRSRVEMEKELDAWIAKVTQPDCARLLSKLFGHKRLREMYCTAPAAAKIHQPYISGLLEHTLNVVTLADSIARLYEPIDRNILITGGLLHDIGKVRELDWRRTITYTTEGRLMGHIPMGASMIDASIHELRKQGGFDEQIQTHLVHLILSHHGKLEWGSPVTPKTREAIVLHYADNTEAYMAVFSAETGAAASRGEMWTKYNKMFDGYLFSGFAAHGGMVPQQPGEPMFQTEKKNDPIEDVRAVR